MWRKRAYGYLGQGHTMSLRARIATQHNEYPIAYFTQLFGLDESITELLLVYMGVHHTTNYFELTKFYRLPDKDDPGELMMIYDAFHSIGAHQVKFIDVMSKHLQKSIDEKNIVLPIKERPRKKRKRKRSPGGKRGVRRRRSRNINRRNW